jgi:hypothetical protein
VACGRLWFFSLKGVDMPKYNYYHQTALRGGYVSNFDLTKHQWDHCHFPDIDDGENLDDFIFANYDTIFMLIYSKFHGLKFHKLLIWHDNKWNKLPEDIPFTFDQKSDIDEDVRCNVEFSISDGILYIAASENGRTKVSKMQMTFDKGRFTGATISFVMSIGPLPITPGARITRLTVHENKIFAFWGCEGCGFRWEPCKPVVADLGTRKWSVVEVPGDVKPPHAFAGPSFCFSFQNKWILMGGSTQHGMTGHNPCREIWIFDLDKRQYRKALWNLPENLTGKQLTMAYDPNKGLLYAADSEHCVYQTSAHDL